MSPALPEPLPSFAVLAFGLVLGSFLNVCIHRLPRGESIAFPGSRCPHCRSAIRWYQNVPLVSFLALRGRCAACGARISWRYPLVEAVTAGMLLALWRSFGPSASFAVAAPFGLALLVLFFTDLDERLLPDAVTLPGAALGLAVSWLNPFLGGGGWRGAALSAAGAALGAGFLWGVGAVYGRLRSVEAMGMGDVKMMAMIGAFAGPSGVAVTLLLASVAGAAVGVARIPLRGGSLRDTLPFGCFLAPAAFAALIAGRWLVERYLGVLRSWP